MGFFSKLGKSGAFGIGGMIGGSMGGDDPGKKQLKQIMGIYKQLQSQQSGLYANALQQQKKGLKSIQGGYDKALGAVGNQGAVAKQQVLSREKSNLGTLSQGLAQSGLGSTSVAQNLQRGVYSDTNRSLAQVDEMLAGMRSSLLAQRAQAEAGQYGALAGLFQNQNASNVGLGSSMINTLGSVQHQDPNAWMGQLAQMGMTAGMAGLSDRRLKTDIRLVGREHDINLYEFRYKSDPSTLWRGVMADEVEDVPGAVDWVGGYRRVDYSKIPVKLVKVG